MKATSKMPVICLAGNARMRGQIHGETLRPLIHEHVQRMHNFVSNALQVDPVAGMNQFIDETGFVNAIQQWTPDLLDELDGMAEAANIDFNTALALNLADETWWYFMEKKGQFISPTVGAENCSSLGVESRDGRPPMIAQNLDMPSYYDGLQVLFHIKEATGSFESKVIAMAGVLGIVGMNNCAVGMCENTLIHLKHSSSGLPVIFVSRGILAQRTLEDTVAFVHTIRHASGQNYVIGSPDGVVDYECSANKVRRFIPFEGAPFVYHTNHALANDDHYALSGRPENSMARFDSVEKDIHAADFIDVDTIKLALRSHLSTPNEVCVHPSEKKSGITANSLIIEHSAVQRMHYTSGPPCETEYLTVSF